MKTFFLAIFTIVISACGPVNYDECVLKEMEGRQAALIRTAENVCEARFPYEKDITEYRDIIGMEFSAQAGDKKHVCLTLSKTEPKYKATKAIVTFHSFPCEMAGNMYDTKQRIDFDFGKEGYLMCAKFEFEPKCMTTNALYGIMKK